MAIQNFIPQLWSARLAYNLEKFLIYGNPNIISTEWEGEIKKQGDVVRITQFGNATIKDLPAGDIDTPEELTDAQAMLAITQKKYFNFMVGDVAKVQANLGRVDEAMASAASGVADAFDQFVAGLYTDVASANKLGSDSTPKTPSNVSDIYDWLVDLGTILSDNKVPKAGRFAIVPPWIAGYLAKDNRFVAYTAGAEARATGGITVGGGFIGRFAGFDVYESPNVPNTNGAKYKVIAGVPSAWARAYQFQGIEAYRPERRFGDAIKGLTLYGAKVVFPDRLALLIISKPS